MSETPTTLAPVSVPPRAPFAAWMVLVLAAAATLAPVWNAPGWPMNHETSAVAQRIHIYARHLAMGDLLPAWSSADNAGFGSPMPLFYHRLFYLVAGPLGLLFGSQKVADALAIGLVLVFGAGGMYRLTGELGAGRLAATTAGISLIAANYTLTNWLVRGAVAELTGAMLVPWLLSGFVRALREERIPLELGIVLGLSWHAHSVMAFYMGLLMSTTFVVLVACRAASLAMLDPRTAWPALGAFALIVLPHLTAMAVFQPAYDVSRILSWPFTPTYQFQEPMVYLWDTHWIPGHNRAGLTMQLDLPILALIAVSCGVGVARGALTRHDLGRLAPVAIPAALCLLLQLPWTDPFYVHVPGAAYLQFPWRLLAVITPALIAVALCLADRGLPVDQRLLAFGLCAGWIMAGSQAFVPQADGRVTVDPVSMATVSSSGFREYEPVTAPPRQDLQAGIAQRWADIGCQTIREDPDEETVRVRFSVTCQRASVVPLPIYASPLHVVHVSGFARSEPCGAVAELPSVCTATVPAGTHTIDLQLPTFPAALRMGTVSVLRLVTGR